RFSRDWSSDVCSSDLDYQDMAGVARVERVKAAYKLASRAFHPRDSKVPLNGCLMGDRKVLVIAGPCSVESRTQIIEMACAVKEEIGRASCRARVSVLI